MSSRKGSPVKGTTNNYHININVSGKYFSAKLQSLRKYPNTLLGSELLCLFYDRGKGEYFFDRDPEIFRFILSYYRMGKLHISEIECPGAFQDELDFFGIPNTALDECCFHLFTKGNRFEKALAPRCRIHGSTIHENHDKRGSGTHRAIEKQKAGGAKDNMNTYNTQEVFTTNDNMSKVKTVEGNSLKTRNSKLTLAYRNTKYKSTERKANQKCNLAQKAWYIFHNKEIPDFLHHLYGILILASSFCNTIETIDCQDNIKCGVLYDNTFFGIETFFVAVFTADYIIRLTLANNKLLFVRKVLNIVDVLAILPYYLELVFTVFVDASDVLITFRVLRVLRLMKLTRNSPRLQTLILTLRNSFKDLLILYFIFVFGIILFGGAIYYVERNGSNAEDFTTIPHSLWFTCVTMVTTGYGDVVPATVFGKIFAALCGFCGVLIMSLPIPIMQERKANQS